MNSKAKIGSMFLLAAVLVGGTIAMTIPKSLAEPEYSNYKDPYVKDHDKEYKGKSVQEIKCVNFNANINGIDINKIPREMTGDAATAQGLQGNENGIKDGNGNGLFGNGGLNIDKNLVNICLNFNFNNQDRIPILGDTTRTAE